MKRNGHDQQLDRRVTLLEKAYLEDRMRWRKQDAAMLAMLHAINGQGEQIKEQGEAIQALGRRLDLHIRQSDERWQKNEERWQKNEARWLKSEEKSRKVDERLEAAIKDLHRLMEK